MNITAYLISLIVCITTAKEAKTVQLSEHQIYPLMLALGKTTLLRFSEKPQKLIIGNKNYFNIENNGTDIALQPLGKVATNLFVYTNDQTFSFTIKVCENCASDDFVNVHRKVFDLPLPKDDTKKRFKEMSLNLVQRFSDLELQFTRIKKRNSTALIDFTIAPKSKALFSANEFKLQVKNVASEMAIKELSGEKQQGRVFIPNSPKSDLTLVMSYKKRKRITIIPRRYLL